MQHPVRVALALIGNNDIAADLMIAFSYGRQADRSLDLSVIWASEEMCNRYLQSWFRGVFCMMI
jgi:hypothetical protein